MDDFMIDLINRARAGSLSPRRMLETVRMLRITADRLERLSSRSGLNVDIRLPDPILIGNETGDEDENDFDAPPSEEPPFIGNQIFVQAGDFDIQYPLGFWTPSYDPNRVRPPYLPPTTPVHPNSPLVLVYDPMVGTYEFSYNVNGWCAVAWIIRTGANAGGSPLAGGTDEAATLISTPSQESIDKVASIMIKANTILFDPCRIALRLCAMHELDARRLFVDVGNRRETVADAFTGGKMVFSQGDTKRDMIDILQDMLNSGEQGVKGGAKAEVKGEVKRTGAEVFADFAERMRRPCLHLFFVNEVDRDDTPDDPTRDTRGVTGRMSLDGRKDGKAITTPVCIVESDDDIGPIMAHEIGHGLGLPHVEDDKEKDVQGDTDNLMNATRTGTRLRPSQCRRMNDFLKKNIAPACPN